MSQPIRVVSDGTVLGTHIYVGDEKVSNVQSVSWSMGVHDQKPTMTLVVKRPDIDLTGELSE